jgi:hypothetical protein
MGIGENYDLVGQGRVSDAEAREHQATLLAKRTTNIPNDLQELYDYSGRTDGQPVYIGYGARSLATSVSGWLVYKYTFDANGFVTSKKTATGIYDNRSSLSYE